jgi:competence ComEA-like helix-hairpin-helix protein
MNLRPSSHEGSVLVGLLWCLALLAVIVISVLHTARMDLQVAKNIGDTTQARYLALAGIEKAKALLYQDAQERKRSARHHTGALQDVPAQLKEIPLGRGRFSVLHQGGPNERRGLLYGVTDEESRLNLNQATAAELGRLRDFPPEVIAAVQDWRDDNNAATSGGAEADYYNALRPPAAPRNGPFETVQELLMVRDFPRRLFQGEDANQNGFLDPGEDDGNLTAPEDNRDGLLDAGWSGLLTVHSSSSSDKTAAGEDRIDLRSADERTLTGIRGITPEIARAIIAHRGQNQFESLVDLLDVGPPRPTGGSGRSTSPAGTGAPGSVQSPGTPVRRASGNPGVPAGPSSAGNTAAGPKLITPELLMEIADDVKVNDDEERTAINVNTASAEVLACLPGVSLELAQAIVNYRRSAGFLPNPAWLLKVDGITASLLKQLWPKVTVRSDTFRIVGEGLVPSSGARQRIEAIVRLREGSFETVSYREDL